MNNFRKFNKSCRKCGAAPQEHCKHAEPRKYDFKKDYESLEVLYFQMKGDREEMKQRFNMTENQMRYAEDYFSKG